MPLPDDLSWTCHVCDEERPDDKIAVAQHDHVYPGGFTVTDNVRYCIDKPECRADAMLRDHKDRMWARTELRQDRIDRSIRRLRFQVRFVPPIALLTGVAGAISYYEMVVR